MAYAITPSHVCSCDSINCWVIGDVGQLQSRAASGHQGRAAGQDSSPVPAGVFFPLVPGLADGVME